jgi:hypothetical protein
MPDSDGGTPLFLSGCDVLSTSSIWDRRTAKLQAAEYNIFAKQRNQFRELRRFEDSSERFRPTHGDNVSDCFWDVSALTSSAENWSKERAEKIIGVEHGHGTRKITSLFLSIDFHHDTIAARRRGQYLVGGLSL